VLISGYLMVGHNKALVTEYSTAMQSLQKRFVTSVLVLIRQRVIVYPRSHRRERAMAAEDVDELDRVNKQIEKLQRDIDGEKEILEKSRCVNVPY
jgi:hypothetical protein